MLLSALTSGLIAALTLNPDSPAIGYTGRWTIDDAPKFSWSSTELAVRFTGAAVAGTFTSPKDGMRLLVLVNGTEHAVHRLPKGKQTVRLATGLPAGWHVARVLKVTEDNFQKGAGGQASFHGLALPEGGAFGDAAPARPKRRLEFVGDSDTAGWCADGSPQSGDKADRFENSHQTWATHLSSALGAEMMVEAISGYGVTPQSTPLQPKAVRTHAFDESSSWDFTRWTPDAIVFLIGPNDERRRRMQQQEEASAPTVPFTADQARGRTFVRDYLEMLRVYVNAYAHLARAHRPRMIHVCGGSINGFDPCADIRDAIGQFNAAHAADGWISNYTSVTKAHWHMINADDGASAYNGCDTHYNGKGHQVIAEDIIADVRRFVGWPDEAAGSVEAA